jgi:hypothetical protein
MNFFQQDASHLQHAIEAIRSPWLDEQDVLRSVDGFAKLQAIGRALRSLPAFDARVTNALRLEPADWRRAIKRSPSIFADPIARSEFYNEHSPNPPLADFPAPAFHEAVSIGGPKAVSPSKDTEESHGFKRTNEAHDLLHRFETKLRRFIEERMTAVFGQDWSEHQVPGDMLKA